MGGVGWGTVRGVLRVIGACVRAFVWLLLFRGGGIGRNSEVVVAAGGHKGECGSGTAGRAPNDVGSRPVLPHPLRSSPRAPHARSRAPPPLCCPPPVPAPLRANRPAPPCCTWALQLPPALSSAPPPPPQHTHLPALCAPPPFASMRAMLRAPAPACLGANAGAGSPEASLAAQRKLRELTAAMRKSNEALGSKYLALKVGAGSRV